MSLSTRNGATPGRAPEPALIVCSFASIALQ
jgi:hypothetical protein